MITMSPERGDADPTITAEVGPSSSQTHPRGCFACLAIEVMINKG